MGTKTFKPKVLWKGFHYDGINYRVVRNKVGALYVEYCSGEDSLGIKRWARVNDDLARAQIYEKAFKAELKKRKVRVA